MQMRSGSVTTVVLASVAGLILMMSMVVPTALIGNYRNGDLDKPTGTFAGSGSSCYLEDKFFTDTSISNDPQAVFEKLITKYKAASDKKEYIEKILSESKKEGVNGAVIIGIWNGEQTFGKPEDAFGFGNLPNGQNLVSGFDNELTHVIRVMKDAINNRGKYTKPEGENIMTRLFYNYAEAMMIQYKESGGKWLRDYKHFEYDNPYYIRLNVIQLLVPDQVRCDINADTFLASSSGNYGCPTKPSIAKISAKGGWGNVISEKDYKVGTYPGHEGYDLFAPVGTDVYSTSDGKVVRVNIDNDGDHQSETSITVLEKEYVYWYYTHIQNIKVKVGDEVKRGQKLAEVGSYIRDGERIHHLHIGISKRLNNRDTLKGAYNWDAWYYPYIFLKDIPCLLPPAAKEVGYNA